MFLSRVISAFLPVCVYYMYLCADDAYVHPTPQLKNKTVDLLQRPKALQETPSLPLPPPQAKTI